MKQDILEQEDFKQYITAEDIKLIAAISCLSIQNIQSVIAGRTKRSKSMPIIIEVAKARRDEARKIAKEIVNH